jgi:hypothetical protein
MVFSSMHDCCGNWIRAWWGQLATLLIKHTPNAHTAASQQGLLYYYLIIFWVDGIT